MVYSYIFLAAAHEEYENALQWYLERSIKAAENFIDAVELTLGLICQHPVRWRNEVDNFYELGLTKYPFTIIYTIDETADLVVVHSIYHHSRNPENKYK